ncbi:vWA domain-containing protein [Sorangium sp. So ce1024]|uniref:vWA domain-containing protein n=1 Tax=Sorangium sp. So ce1024 TaxID=3133327 RepID=UPI003F0814CC
MRLSTMAIALSLVAAVGAACSVNPGAEDGADTSPNNAGGGAASGSGVGSTSGSGSGTGGSSDSGFGETGNLNSGGSAASSGTGSTGDACATKTSEAGFQQVYLAFAFDVSASMGSNDVEWRSKALKWDPVVDATKQFFLDSASTGFKASLTFFPGPGGRREMCSSDSYTTPAVPMTVLPSPAFGEAIDAVTPPDDRSWRIGTPTAYAMEGILEFIEAERQQNPGKYAIVLVTDGYPEQCRDDSDSIEAVVERVGAALDSGISTFVIGVDSPPGPGSPPSLTNLHQIAEAGGTGEAFMLDTGNAAETSAAFTAAIEAIRGAAVSCTIPIPPAPDGRNFDKKKVVVTYTSTATSTPTPLGYDQACATENAWRYDEPLNPTAIVLCNDTCAAVQAQFEVSLGVDFTCEDVIEVPL